MITLFHFCIKTDAIDLPKKTEKHCLVLFGSLAIIVFIGAVACHVDYSYLQYSFFVSFSQPNRTKTVTLKQVIAKQNREKS